MTSVGAGKLLPGEPRLLPCDGRHRQVPAQGGETPAALSPCQCLPQTFIVAETLVSLPFAPKGPSRSNTPSLSMRLHVLAQTRGRLLRAATSPGPSVLPVPPSPSRLHSSQPQPPRPFSHIIQPRPPPLSLPRSTQGVPRRECSEGGPGAEPPSPPSNILLTRLFLLATLMLPKARLCCRAVFTSDVAGGGRLVNVRVASFCL